MSPPQASEGWQRNVWALALCVFIAFVGFQFFSPFLPLYVRELGVTDRAQIALWSGLLAAVTPAVSGFLSPLFGRLADRFGRKLMLIRSLAGFTVIIAAVGPVVGGVVASPLGTRAAFFVTAGMCALSLIALIFLFHEARPLEPGEARAARATPLRECLRYRHFAPVMILLLIAQFIDRGLVLLIPLQVAHLPDVEASAATSGVIISVAA